MVTDPTEGLGLLEKLVRTPSDGPEGEGLEVVEDWLRNASVTAGRFRSAEPLPPVLWAGRRPGRKGPRTVFAVHWDTVPSPPGQRGYVLRDRTSVHGRGALDMKAGVALALILLRDHWRTFPGGLGLLVTTDEERESAGAWSVVRAVAASRPLVLVPEPTGERVNLLAWGRVVLEAGYRGEGGHGEGFGRPDRPRNPIDPLALALSALPRGVTALGVGTQGEGEVTVPRRAFARLDVVVPPGRTGEDRRKEVVRAFERVGRRFAPLETEVAWAPRSTPWLPSYRTDRSLPSVRRFLRAVREATGGLVLAPQTAVGDFNVFGQRLPTIVYGPGGSGAHADQERVSRASFARCLSAYERFLEGAGPFARTIKRGRP